MSKLNFLVFLNAYEDNRSSNAPNRSNFKWERDVNGILVNNPTSLEFTLAPGESRTLFNGQRTLTMDGSTQFSISLVPFSTTEYILKWVGGAAPTFRASRNEGANASTQVTVTVNGPIATFTSVAGQLFNLVPGGTVVGDFVRIGSQFNPANQGEWQIVSMSNVSFSVVNPSASAEGPITLGLTYLDQVNIYSSAGVQVNDTLSISGGFSPVTWGSYIVTSVADTYIQFSSVNPLPQESFIVTQAIVIYSMAKKLIYMEADQRITMVVNGVPGNNIEPFVLCDCDGAMPDRVRPGIFMRTSTIYSLVVTNSSINNANVFLASVE